MTSACRTKRQGWTAAAGYFVRRRPPEWGFVGERPLRAPGDVLVHLRRARDHADRHYAEPLDVDALAARARPEQVPLPAAVPRDLRRDAGEYVSRRRIERAQDLLRATNLTVTEVCHAVGFSSLGSFSSRFRAVVGESPSQFQRRYAAGAPHIPGCFVFMWGLAERLREREEKRDGRRPAS